MSTTRDQIIEGAARAFWVDAYARHVEDFENSKQDYPEADWREEFCPAEFGGECRTFGTHARPGPGEDWMDFAPPTGEAAFERARELMKHIEAENMQVGRSLGQWAEGLIPDFNLFGHYLAMEAMGHGVSREDDHEPHGLKVPHMEFYL